MESKIVARFRDGKVMKGTTTNFSPTKATFHLAGAQGKIVEIALADLKAVFFVKTFEGDPDYNEKRQFDLARMYGRKVRCSFPDGEVLTGYTQGFAPDRQGFFVIPSDPQSNNERVFVVNAPNVRVELNP